MVRHYRLYFLFLDAFIVIKLRLSFANQLIRLAFKLSATCLGRRVTFFARST